MMQNKRAFGKTPHPLSKLQWGSWLLTLATMLTFSAATLAAADYLPLAPGNNWTYRDATTGSTLEVEVGLAPVSMNHHTYYVLKGYTPQQVLVRTNEYGNIIYWNEDHQAEEMLISFEIVPGGWFDAGARACLQFGQVQEKAGVHTGPAGDWSVLDIVYRTFACADTGELSEQFAPNIGMVRRVANTFAGPRTYDLVAAHVGKQSVTADQAGSFGVSAVLNPQHDAWTATLRVDQSSGDGIQIHFPSSQEFDLRLRDADGKVLWTWSADKLFLQAEHDRTVVGHWSQAVSVPVPPGIPEIRRTFTLEAWLTTREGDPKFAAAAVIDVPGIDMAGSARTTRAGR